MKTITYKEAIEHVRKYKEFIRVGAIANRLNMNQGQLRQIINKVGYAVDLPVRYREDFIKIVTELTRVRQYEELTENTISEEIDLFYRKSE